MSSPPGASAGPQCRGGSELGTVRDLGGERLAGDVAPLGGRVLDHDLAAADLLAADQPAAGGALAVGDPGIVEGAFHARRHATSRACPPSMRGGYSAAAP